MGFFLGLDSEEYDREYRDRDLVRRVLTYFSDHKQTMFIVLCEKDAIKAEMVILSAGVAFVNGRAVRARHSPSGGGGSV